MAIENNVLDAMKTVAQSEVSKVKYDRTIVAEIIGAVENTSNRYWVSNGAVRFQANAADAKSKYSAGQKVYVTIPNDDYSSENKVITGAYSEEDGYQIGQSTDPFEDMIIAKSYEWEPNIKIETIREIKDTKNLEDKEKVSIEQSLFYSNMPKIPLNYFGVELNFSTYDPARAFNLFVSGEFQIIISFGDNDYIISSKELIGNPFNLTKQLSHKKLFNIIDFDKIFNSNKIKIELKFVSLKKNKDLFPSVTDFSFQVELNKIKIIFGYKKTAIQKSQLNLYDLGGSIWEYDNTEEGDTTTKNSGRTILLGEYIDVDNSTIITAPVSKDNKILIDNLEVSPTEIRIREGEDQDPFWWGKTNIKSLFNPTIYDREAQYSLVPPYGLQENNNFIYFVKIFQYDAKYEVVDDSNAGSFWKLIGVTGCNFLIDDSINYQDYQNSWEDFYNKIMSQKPTLLFSNTLNPYTQEDSYKIGLYSFKKQDFEYAVSTINKLIELAKIEDEKKKELFNTNFKNFLTQNTTYIESDPTKILNLTYDSSDDPNNPDQPDEPDIDEPDNLEELSSSDFLQLTGSDDGIYNFYDSSGRIAQKKKLYENHTIKAKLVNKEYMISTLDNQLYQQGKWDFNGYDKYIFLSGTGTSFKQDVKETILKYIKQFLRTKGIFNSLEDLEKTITVSWENNNPIVLETTDKGWVKEEKGQIKSVECNLNIPVIVNGISYKITLLSIDIAYILYIPYYNYRLKEYQLDDSVTIKCTITDLIQDEIKYSNTFSCYLGEVQSIDNNKYNIQVFFKDKEVHGINVQKENNTAEICCSINSPTMTLTPTDKERMVNQLRIQAPGFLSINNDDQGELYNRFYNGDIQVGTFANWYSFTKGPNGEQMAYFLWDMLDTYGMSEKIDKITKIKVMGTTNKDKFYYNEEGYVFGSTPKVVFNNLDLKYDLETLPQLCFLGNIIIYIYFTFTSDLEATNNNFYPIRFVPNAGGITYNSIEDYFTLGTVFLNNGFNTDNQYYVPLDCMTNTAVLEVALEDTTTYFPIPVYYYITNESFSNSKESWDYDIKNNILLDGSTIITYDVNNNNLKNYIDIPYQIYENGVTKLEITETPEIWDINKNTEKITFSSQASGSETRNFEIQGVNQNYYQTGTESKVTIHSPFRGYEKAASIPNTEELKIQALLKNNYYLQLPSYFDYKRKVAVYCLRVPFKNGLWLQPIIIKSENWDNSMIKNWDNEVEFQEEENIDGETNIVTKDRYLLPNTAAGDKKTVTNEKVIRETFSGVMVGSIFNSDSTLYKKGLFCFDNIGYCNLELTADGFLLGNKNYKRYISFLTDGFNIGTDNITSNTISASTITTNTINIKNCLINRSPIGTDLNGVTFDSEQWSEKINTFYDKIPLKIFTNETSKYYYMGYVPNEMEFSENLSPYFNVKNNAIRYDEFIALNTWQIQKLKKRVAELEQEIKEIK